MIAALAIGMFAACAASGAEPSVSEHLEPAELSLGGSAQLTIETSGSDTSPVAPPVVPGLEFVAIGQSQQIQSINGVTTSSISVTYEVIPQEAGIFTIPSLSRGSQPLVLRVNPAGSTSGSAARNAPGGTAAGNNPQGSGAPPSGAGGSGDGAAHQSDGAAFVRLRLPKHELYVGETVPADIQVVMRDGFVASLNGLPTLNGDAFTLNKLSSQPERTEETIDGKPFTVLTWHSVLSAVKPGALSLMIETPLTVRIRTRSRSLADLFGDSRLADAFNDPVFQNFFGGTTEKEVTVASAPTAFTVLALPTKDQPAGFGGAVGTFQISSELSDTKVAAGDPLTLRIHITGEGNFDRVNHVMLDDVAHWKTYQPTAVFKPSDNTGYRGEKTFEQPLIAAQPGAQTLPGLTFSYFDPKTGRYEVARTEPLRVAVAPASGEDSLASANQAAANPAAGLSNAPTPSAPTPGGLRPDHAESGAFTASLLPPYWQPRILAIPAALLVAFSGAWFWLRRRENAAREGSGALRRTASQTTEALLGQMEAASSTGDAPLFFNAARDALRCTLAGRWKVTPEKITLADIDARLGGESDIRRVFALADETNYSGRRLESGDLQRWKEIVLRQIRGEQA
jgi:hypothetical protein